MDPMTDADLVAFVLGELPPQEAQQFERMLQTSAPDRLRVDRLRQAIAAMRTDRSQPAPASVRERALALFRIAPQGWFEGLRRTAALMFDSGAQPAAAGFRSAATGLSWTFDSELGEVDLQAEPDDRQPVWRIVGQVAGESAADLPVGLVRTGETTPVSQTCTDARGGFSLHAPAGVYDLLLRSGETLVVLSGLRMQ